MNKSLEVYGAGRHRAGRQISTLRTPISTNLKLEKALAAEAGRVGGLIRRVEDDAERVLALLESRLRSSSNRPIEQWQGIKDVSKKVHVVVGMFDKGRNNTSTFHAGFGSYRQEHSKTHTGWPNESPRWDHIGNLGRRLQV